MPVATHGQCVAAALDDTIPVRVPPGGAAPFSGRSGRRRRFLSGDCTRQPGDVGAALAPI
jgi:hypothetical protein